MSMRPGAPGNVHVVRGSSAGAVLGRHGLLVEVVDDSLVYGPVSLNLAQHGRLRRDFWRHERALGPGLPAQGRFAGSRGHVAFPDLRAAIVQHGARNVVLWLSPLWPDVLFFWWVSHGLLTSGVPGAKLFVAHPRNGAWPGAMNPSDIDAARVEGPLRTSDIRHAARLWEHFASPSPAALDRALRAKRGSTRSSALNYYARLLPRLGARNTLLPSVADAWLLSGFDCTKPAHAVMSNPWGREPDQWLLNMGEEFIFTRLWRWSTHQNGRWLTGLPEPDRDLRYVRYTLTEECRELLDAGTTRGSDLAPITVGGLHVPDEPWLCIFSVRGDSLRVSRRRVTSRSPRRRS